MMARKRVMYDDDCLFTLLSDLGVPLGFIYTWVHDRYKTICLLTLNRSTPCSLSTGPDEASGEMPSPDGEGD
jgi:hypothetical protein